MRKIQYDEPVVAKDIEAEVGYAEEGIANFSEFYYRLSAQCAPPALVEEMAAIARQYDEVKKRLQLLLQSNCFPR